ncbi:hypothetical protein D5F01_LYC00642 [Larimichthys crocea]|uniref:Ig-like domain-containing protein n=1 Tax=Larimichthys crocea TaxID=215358 RepID=A0A6G0JAD5_LARCR|nr:hypothetical protein D5F01_LYC00642 [Larimichthys crocea]
MLLAEAGFLFMGFILYVSDLQVKVIPTTEGQRVSLMCSTSCPLTENPAVYIWYKNREFLYEDWSPWYQQLVSSEEAVTYSCAIKGYEDLRAPEVSVELRVQKTHEERYVLLTCGTSCPLIDAQTAYKWYQGGNYLYNSGQQFFVTTFSDEGHSCAVNNHEDLHSAQVCPDDENCWSVNYVSRRICALQGSSVNISSEYLHPENQQPKSKCWYKIKRSVEEDAEELIKAAVRVEYHDNMKNHHILTINDLKKSDSAEYKFRLQKVAKEWKQSVLPGVTLVVTALTVKFASSAVVTEGQRVTLTCSTSCPLSDNTNYIWYLNSRPLTLPENQHKQLVLDPVSSQHAGRYSCAVKTHNILSSFEKTLTVHSNTGKWTAAAAAGGVAGLLLIITLAVFFGFRRKRASSQSPGTETSDNLEQLNPGPVYEEVSAQPKEQHDPYYSRVHFTQNHTDPLYSMVQPHEHQEQLHEPYAVISIRPNTLEHSGQAEENLYNLYLNKNVH